jgi:hypothetical protein
VRLRHLEAAELGPPLVARRRADGVLSAYVKIHHLGLLLVQDANDLLIGEPRLLHPSAP